MNVHEFVRESNRIEGIHRDPTQAEIAAMDSFLSLEWPTVGDLEVFVSINQPGAVLRRKSWQNVRVGSHTPPEGGPWIERELTKLLNEMIDQGPFETHHQYETLHPFTDGNGRSGRALWAWQMLQQGRSVNLGFLHTWYYQSLQAAR